MGRPSKELMDKARRVVAVVPGLINGNLTTEDHELLKCLAPVDCLSILIAEIDGLIWEQRKARQKILKLIEKIKINGETNIAEELAEIHEGIS